MKTEGESSLRFVPRSVSDSVAGNNSPPGACAALSNLIFDPSTPGVMVCRPANSKITDFSTLPGSPGTPGVVTVAFQIDQIVYGLVGITAGTYAGLDYPFAYNLTTGAFLTVSGITTAKCPTSQATAGAWTPPQMSMTGVDLVVSHIGFPGVTYFFGWFDLTTPTAPVWHAGNTTTNALPSVPQAVQQFNNRTYFFCGNTAYYTDTLALTMTNSNQSFTLGDLTPVTCAAPLPQAVTSQGIVQGILAFKLSQIFVITGDVTETDLSVNLLSPSVGTAAPRSVVPTPDGVRFMAIDGIRNINYLGQVSEPDNDLALPFVYALTPSRVCAAFNSNVYRICVQNGGVSGSPYQDYWYDYRRKGWTGPHSFRYDVAVPYLSDFVVASNSLTASLWSSYAVQGHNAGSDTFVENGAQLTWNYETCPMTDLDNLYANNMKRTTIELANPGVGASYVFAAQNEAGSSLATGTVSPAVVGSIWDAFNWGAASWGAGVSGLIPLTIPWNLDAVFNRLVLTGMGNSASGLKLGAFRIGYKQLGYVLN